MNAKKTKDRKRSDLNNQIIQRKNDEIECLKNKISDLEISCEEKDELINSVDSLRLELKEVIDDLKTKRDEYDRLISELFEMRKVFNQDVFKGRWKLIRLLMK